MMNFTPIADHAGLDATGLDELRTAMQTYIDDEKLASIVTVVWKDGELAMMDAYGVLDFESQVPTEIDSIFRIYSMTKPITGTALMTLYEQGRFQLDDPVANYLPEFADVQVFVEEKDDGTLVTEPCASPMTIRHLMTHTAGLSYGWAPNHPVDKMYREAEINSYGGTVAGNVEKLGELPLLYHPGTKWQYSVAVDVQARLIEVLSGMEYRDYLKQSVLDPLGMVDTDFFVPEDKRHRFTTNYGPGENSSGLAPSALAMRGDPFGKADIERVDHPGHGSIYDTLPSYRMGGGGLVSTALDYLTFTTMLVQKGEVNGTRILKTETVELMTQNHIPDNLIPINLEGMSMPETGFGLDLCVRMTDEVDYWPGVVGEYGWSGAASTHFFVAPEQNLVGILLTQMLPAYTYLIEIEFKKHIYAALT
jgi:CubicO group peptidase (beta-lactamase class C family)